MRRFFDTSVLIAASYTQHVHHVPSAAVVATASKQDACALRTLAEIYSVTTGLRAHPRTTAKQAISIIERFRKALTIVSLSDDEFLTVIARTAAGGIIGGAIYDALIAECAVKARADLLVTWNVRDFIRFPKVAAIVKTPSELLSL